MSGFDIKKLALFFPKKSASSTGLVFCESSTPVANPPKHIRRKTYPGMISNVGAGRISLCGTKVSTDKTGIDSLFALEQVQSKSQPSAPLCAQCLSDARLLLDVK